MRRICVLGFLVCLISRVAAAGGMLSVTTFEADVTPPLGAPLCGGAVEPAKVITDPLGARGIVLYPGADAPLVLCAVDWVGIGNSGHEAWCASLAEAAGTTPDRVAVQTLHQHDAPFCDFDTEALLAAQGLGGTTFDVEFAREALRRTAEAIKTAAGARQPVTHLGIGQAKVDRVASNRRILGPDGKVSHVRWTATVDPYVRSRGEGTIDPYVKTISLWNGNTPVAILTYYATHPQSHYGKGCVSADFVGMARSLLQTAAPGVAVIHFDGAGGNIGAGKYNDGNPENRPVLAARLAQGMKAAWAATERQPLDASEVAWHTREVLLPLREEISDAWEQDQLADASASVGARASAASELAWRNRVRAGKPILVSCLSLGPARVLNLPGELFVEYQLAAQEMRPELFVAMAAYGDYGPGYIGTSTAYPEEGYETGIHVSRVAPAVEGVLMDTMRDLLAK